MINNKPSRYAIVSAEFNRIYCDRLVEGAVDAFAAKGIDKSLVDVFFVPGTYEVPLAVKRLAKLGRYVGVVAIGVLVKGDTLHFECIAENACRALTDIGLEFDLPIGLSVIPAFNLEQVKERSAPTTGPDAGENRGYEAALAVVEMSEFPGSLG